MDNRYIAFSNVHEDGLDIGDSLSDQLGCFTVAAAAIAVTATIVATISTLVFRLTY